MKNAIEPLDIMTAILSYISIFNYGENIEQNGKLDLIITNIEEKLDYQNKMLQKILERIEEQNGVSNLHK